MSNTIEELRFANFHEKIANGTTIVKFWSQYCGPCKAYSTNFESFAEKHSEIHCYSVDGLNETEIVRALGIRAVPITIIFDKGKEVKRFGGVKTVEQIETELL